MSEYVIDDRDMPKFRVNRAAMTDPAVLERERERIFDRTWLYIGHETELTKRNDFLTRNVAGRPMIFFRDHEGKIQVWANSCPHRGAMLCREKQGNARFMTCFYHGWAFNNAGKMVSMPSDEAYGPDFDRPGLAAPARVDSYRGFVFVSFDPEVEELVEYLAGAREYIDLVMDQSEVGMRVVPGTHEYSVKANWKLLVENSVDGYHAITTHQRYFEMIVAARGEIPAGALARSSSLDLGNGHAVAVGEPVGDGLLGRPLSEAAKAERAARFARLRERYGDAWVDRMDGTRNLIIFPNLVLIDLVMGVVVRKIDPVTPDYMEVTGWELVPAEDGPELTRHRLDDYLTFWGPGGLATPDDVEALETCQRSFATRAELPWSDISRGMNTASPVSTDELQMRVFWRRWNALVTGEQLPDEPHDPPSAFYLGQRREPAEGVVAAADA
ncbi:aromatic ring-hydroxylating oxygenase subunit alpha [Pseudonocardia sp. CA-107938]|uniref:aromatic ring-hydroxylating oxygenase subunit alpha n=1 Tax=Pseudonocardia sp. CA-107938 TaxID=3240021 RepID=UPI003D8D7C7B